MDNSTSDIYSILAKKYNLHRSIISVICNHPFIFASRRMADPNNEKTFMFAYLFKIKLKKRLIGKKRDIYDARKIKKNIDK